MLVPKVTSETSQSASSPAQPGTITILPSSVAGALATKTRPISALSANPLPSPCDPKVPTSQIP